MIATRTRIAASQCSIALDEHRQEFQEEVLRGLSAPEKTLPCKYFYDQAGSRLFEEICSLPEYYLTRAELEILERHAPEIANCLGAECVLIEYGSGASLKTRLLLDHLESPAAYVPIDVSREQLRSSAAAIARDYKGIEVRPICGDFTRVDRIPLNSDSSRPRVVYFPGSTIGNFHFPDAAQLLRRTARLCNHGGGLLLGADLKKDPRVLTAAYNDGRGTTAAFNLNLLARINRELDANFRTEQFWHYAPYNPTAGRMEMHLVSQCAQSVSVGNRTFRFAEGESIRTECSYKYSPGDLVRLAECAGFEVRQVWTDRQRAFCLSYWSVKPRRAVEA